MYLFLNFLTRVGFDRIGRKLFLFSIFRPVLARSSWNDAWRIFFFNFWNFFAFIFEFSKSGRARTDRKEIFFVLYFSACPCPFRLEMKPGGFFFLIFEIFSHLFLNFLTRVGFERIGRKFFLFSNFHPVLARFVL